MEVTPTIKVALKTSQKGLFFETAFNASKRLPLTLSILEVSVGSFTLKNVIACIINAAEAAIMDIIKKPLASPSIPPAQNTIGKDREVIRIVPI